MSSVHHLSVLHFLFFGDCPVAQISHGTLSSATIIMHALFKKDFNHWWCVPAHPKIDLWYHLPFNWLGHWLMTKNRERNSWTSGVSSQSVKLLFSSHQLQILWAFWWKAPLPSGAEGLRRVCRQCLESTDWDLFRAATNSLSTQRLWPCTSISARTAVYQHAPGRATTMRNPGLPLNSDSWGGRRVFLETKLGVGKSQTAAWVFSHRHPTWIFCETIMLITTANFYYKVLWTLQEACFPTHFSVFGVYAWQCYSATHKHQAFR